MARQDTARTKDGTGRQVLAKGLGRALDMNAIGATFANQPGAFVQEEGDIAGLDERNEMLTGASPNILVGGFQRQQEACDFAGVECRGKGVDKDVGLERRR